MQDLQDLQEKVKKALLLTDEDIPLLLNCDFKTLLVQNKEAAIRSIVAYIGILVAILLYLGIFSFFGAFVEFLLTALFFGAIAAGVLLKKDTVRELTQYPLFAYLAISVFGLMVLFLFSSISSQGSFFFKFLFLLIACGIGGGIYSFRDKAAAFNLSVLQLVVIGLFAGAFISSLQMSAIRFINDAEIEMAQQRSEMRRRRDAEQMSINQASMKVCSSEEECRKMNMKKNAYYSSYEEVAQETCEAAVSKEISGRFEWTVSPKDYKFNRYEVDVLKDEITLFGDSARLIANNNAKTNVTYSCKYNTKKKTAKASVQKAG